MSKTKKKILALFLTLIALSAVGCFEGKTVVTRVSPHTSGRPQPKMNGVLFALPRTVVKIDVPVVRTERTRGQFFALSPFFFPGEPFIKKTGVTLPTESDLPVKVEGVRYGLDAPKFGVRGKPDPEQTFMVHIRGGRFETKTLLLEVTEDGIIAKAEAESKNETIDFVTQGLKSVTSIAAPLLPLGLSPAARLANRNSAIMESQAFEKALEQDFCQPLKKQADKNKDGIPDKDASGKFIYEDTEESLFCQSLTTIEKIIYVNLTPSYRTFLKEKIKLQYLKQLSAEERQFFWTLKQEQIDYFTNLNEDYQKELHRAKLVYDKIQELLEQRASLVRSEPPPISAPDVLTNKLKELDEYAEGYKQSYFTGVTGKATSTGNFEFDPSSAPMEQPLFTYSETEGICSTDDGAVGPKGLQFAPNFKLAEGAVCKKPQKVLVKLNLRSGQFSDSVTSANFNETGQRGFYYRVPAKVSAVLYVQSAPAGGGARQQQQQELPLGKEVGRDELAIAQLGPTVSLPASTGGRRSSYKLVYYDATGAVKTFNIGSDALIQKSNLTDVEAAATQLRDSKLTKLERETKLLKAEKDRLDAENALKKAKEENANSNANTSGN
jgi:hypothetical protein